LLRFIKNIYLFLEFLILKTFFYRKSGVSKNILFVNTGQIGDLLVSSLLLENDNLLPGEMNYYLLVKDNYKDLFIDNSSRFQILYYNPLRYKFNLFYKISFLLKLRNISFSRCYNLTLGRGLISDQLALLSSSTVINTISRNKIYLGDYWFKKINYYYDNVYFENIKNEYEKHLLLVKMLNDGKNAAIKFNNDKLFKLDDSSSVLRKYGIKDSNYILIAPLTGDMKRSWGLEKYKLLIDKLSEKHKIVLIGSDKEKAMLKDLSGDNQNVNIILPELCEIPSFIVNCSLYIGNHSGLSHFALKYNVYFLVILDGGFYDMYMPFNTSDPKNNYIFNKLPCFGCQMFCIYKEYYCLTDIKYEEVYEKVMKILNE
jgi:ADP-heptose:LPS heptosyltransferase